MEPAAPLALLANSVRAIRLPRECRRLYSGASEQNYEVNGVRYSHILNPKTGLGLTTNITTTVIARLGVDADGMATAINVLGADRGLAFIDKQSGVAAVVATGTAVCESTSFHALSR
jgi:thiamine biosynthesis lipoprotein